MLRATQLTRGAFPFTPTKESPIRGGGGLEQCGRTTKERVLLLLIFLGGVRFSPPATRAADFGALKLRQVRVSRLTPEPPEFPRSLAEVLGSGAWPAGWAKN